jgi:hypothetical protein
VTWADLRTSYEEDRKKFADEARRVLPPCVERDPARLRPQVLEVLRRRLRGGDHAMETLNFEDFVWQERLHPSRGRYGLDPRAEIARQSLIA